VTEYKADCDSLPDRLQLVLQHVSVGEADAAKVDRVKTAKAVKALLAACDGKEPTALVGIIARAKLDTSSTAMGRSLKSAKGVLDSLKATRWDLFTAVSQIDDARKTNADLLLDDVHSWLKTDEHALAGGVAAKLSEAEGRAIKLLTPPKVTPPVPPVVPQPPVVPPPPQPSGPDWRMIQSDAKARLTEKELLGAADELARKLRENPRYRLSIQWTLEEPQ
jgi:hypothetical protein